MDETLSYYNNNAESFVEATLNADMSELHELFLRYLPQNSRILDLGCGAGRDSKCFIEKGFRVHALDGSPHLCKIAGDLLGQSVECKKFADIDFNNEFDGVWACASLLHVPFSELGEIFDKISKSLKMGGILYMSFKYGSEDEVRGERSFTNMNEQRFSALLTPLSGYVVKEILITNDVRPERSSDQWFNILLQKNQ